MDNYIRNFFDNKKRLIITFLIVITLVALFARYKMYGFVSWDYEYCIEEWIKKITELGGFASLKYEVGNYNIIYMLFLVLVSYIPIKHIIVVKTFSVIFDIIIAIFGALIVGLLLEKNKNKGLYQALVYTLLLFIPSMLLNSALWGQCDSIYTAFTLISIYYLLKEKYIKAFIFAGIAFAFKLQFIFILPLYLLIYFKKKDFSILNFLIIPLVNLITCLPAIIAGRNIGDCLMIYFKQTGAQNTSLTNNFPNIYKFIDMFFGANQGTVSILITIVVIGIIFLYIIYKDDKLSNKNIINYGLLFVIVMTQLLPYMHERYAFTAEILLCIYVILNNGKGLIYLFITELAIGSEYLSFLSSINQDYVYFLSFIYVVTSLLFCIKLVNNDINFTISMIREDK